MYPPWSPFEPGIRPVPESICGGFDPFCHVRIPENMRFFWPARFPIKTHRVNAPCFFQLPVNRRDRGTTVQFHQSVPETADDFRGIIHAVSSLSETWPPTLTRRSACRSAKTPGEPAGAQRVYSDSEKYLSIETAKQYPHRSWAREKDSLGA